MAKKPGVNVVRRGDQWAIVRDNAERATAITDTQREAIERAREIARRDQTELRIQGENGRWRDSDSYGNDPAPPIDRQH